MKVSIVILKLIHYLTSVCFVQIIEEHNKNNYTFIQI